jgi:hypothetical protein
VPAISVLMPVRDGARFLDAALASLAAQTFRDFEIILVENGSADGSSGIVAAWAKREPRLRAFRLDRGGLAASLNFAAAQARAPLLARLDADDIAHPHRLALQYRAMLRNRSLGLLGTMMEFIDRRGRSLGRSSAPLGHAALKEHLQTSCGFIQSSVMMRAEIFHRAGGYRPGLNISEDYDLWARMAELCRCANLPDVLGGYRVHPASLTSRYPARMAIASLCVSAALEARRTGRPEPFSAGTPNLRLALPLLAMSPARSRSLVRLRVARIVMGRAFQAFPLPGLVRALVRRLVNDLGVRQLYVAGLRTIMGLSGEPAALKNASL